MSQLQNWINKIQIQGLRLVLLDELFEKNSIEIKSIIDKSGRARNTVIAYLRKLESEGFLIRVNGVAQATDKIKNHIPNQKKIIKYDQNSIPVQIKYDLELFYEKTNKELALLYGVNQNCICRIRKKLNIPKFIQIRDRKFLEFLKEKEKNQIKELYYKDVCLNFKYEIPKSHVLRIIVNNSVNINFMEYPIGYKFPHGSRGYKNFGCRCEICTKSHEDLYYKKKIKEAMEIS